MLSLLEVRNVGRYRFAPSFESTDRIDGYRRALGDSLFYDHRFLRHDVEYELVRAPGQSLYATFRRSRLIRSRDC